ncbi:GH25 family lysozyme [Pediococcus acidilactici]|uniref:GH25 family lysozyme n=1 Tax=Pediococcus acidilactici TaxID=1254 RepID=UPI00232D21AD|nr:GH25 family lysozyme [Pediococcus acidilactici]MDB8867886.1 GH25 family lysozyme [Pediococcus acidilactici]
MANLFTDVSSWNDDSQSFFNNLANQGVKATVVKITEGSEDGTNYVNPKAANQIMGALNAGMQAHCYHFARFTSIQDAKNEAEFFVKHVKAFGMDPTTILVVDVESDDLTKDPQALTDQINAFLKVVKSSGYPKCDVYASASWFNQPRFYRDQLIPKNCWVANYGRPQPDVEDVGSWQFTDNWNGMGIDMSYDFFGFYTE